MKLLSIQLDTPFNSLQPFKKFSFNYFSEKKNIIEPICLVGSNGAGKSNLLELICEIFFFVEMEVRFKKKGNRKTNREYSIEYILFFGDRETKVLIDSIGDKKWKMFIKDASKNEDNEWTEITTEYENVKRHLPSKIVGYTSGLNETLSFRFNQLNAEYAELVRDAGFNKLENTIEDNRLLFIDYDLNASILISNFLLQNPNQLNIFRETTRVVGIDHIKISLDFELSKNRYVQLTKEHQSIINKLKACATTFNINKEGDQFRACTFEYVVNNATKDAFSYNFEGPYDLFMSFQKLELLNELKLNKKYRYISGKNISQKSPKVGFEDRIFRFDDIQLIIESPKNVIPYIGISDGEHQFIQVVGSIMLFDQANTLYLYDEPETHFNPQWRSKLISIINETTKDRYQEMVQSTHSPFVVSDCKGYNVLKFTRVENEVKFEHIGIETYGTSILVILKEVFGRTSLISELARGEINDAIESNNMELLLNTYEELGESADRDLLLEKINRINLNN